MTTITAEKMAEIRKTAEHFDIPIAIALLDHIDQLTARALAAEAEIKRRDAMEPVGVRCRHSDGGIKWASGVIFYDKIPDGTPLFTYAPAPVVPLELHPASADLLQRFFVALGEKMLAAQQKYGRETDWMSDDWAGECQRQLIEHIGKGDPRDVAIYAAFLWHHDWPSILQRQPVPDEPPSALVDLVEEHCADFIPSCRKEMIDYVWDECRAAMLKGGAE